MDSREIPAYRTHRALGILGRIDDADLSEADAERLDEAIAALRAVSYLQVK
jgi:hypothetical protein